MASLGAGGQKGWGVPGEPSGMRSFLLLGGYRRVGWHNVPTVCGAVRRVGVAVCLTIYDALATVCRVWSVFRSAWWGSDQGNVAARD